VTHVHANRQRGPSGGLDLMATTPVHAIATGVLQELDLVRESLAAEYEIIEELGRGGMAMVYRARDRQLEREVAVKVLPFSLAFDTEFVERFQREARAGGCETIGGLAMLVAQAAEQFKLWTGQAAPFDVMNEAAKGRG